MHNSKKIEFSKSTLLSLKAELLRKQDEVCKAKLDPRNQVNTFKPAISKSSDKSGKRHKLPKPIEADDPEVNEALRKSRDVLEKKAQLYDFLSQGLQPQNSEQYLVEFHKKNVEGTSSSGQNLFQSGEACFSSKEEVDKRDTEFNNDGCEDEWVEYVDCVGRTRKCHKSDLPVIRERDKCLQESLKLSQSTTDQTSGGQALLPPKEIIKEGDMMPDSELQSPDAYKEMLRHKWEDKEMELLQKDTIHYQDVLFDEARAHGAAYYAFSTEQSIRARQHAELRAARAETSRAQSEAEERRTARDLLMKERVRAARARQRARAGLPPEEEAPQASVTELLLDFVDQQRLISDERDKEEERKKREELEKERQKERENFVREWDMGKEGTEGYVFKEMSQEQWVATQREKRDKEFAPIGASQDTGRNMRAFDSKGSDINRPKTWDEVRPKVPQKIDEELFDSDYKEQRGLFFTSKRRLQQLIKDEVKPEHLESSVRPTPIIDELSYEDDDSDESIEKPEERMIKPYKGTEVAPPPTYDYYGPTTSKKQRYAKQTVEQMEDAIEKGLKKLREQSDKKHSSNTKDFLELNI